MITIILNHHNKYAEVDMSATYEELQLALWKLGLDRVPEKYTLQDLEATFRDQSPLEYFGEAGKKAVWTYRPAADRRPDSRGAGSVGGKDQTDHDTGYGSAPGSLVGADRSGDSLYQLRHGQRESL